MKGARRLDCLAQRFYAVRSTATATHGKLHSGAPIENVRNEFQLA